MDIEKFHPTDAPGNLTPISGPGFEYVAFVPDPLHDVYQLSGSVLRSMSEADRDIGRLDLASQRLPDPLILVRPTLIREAVSTSALEGTFTRFRDVLEADLMEEEKTSAEIHEVRNYIEAALIGFEMVKDRPIRFSQLADLQRILVKGTRGDLPDAGALRTTQVFIGERHKPIEASRFIPPPPGHLLEEGVRQWESWINDENDIPLLIKLALGHYQFETLHPFSDGNGRLGRLIIMLQLIAAGELTYPIFNIAPFFDEHKRDYKDHMLAVSQTGNIEPWLEFFFQAIKHQAKDSTHRVSQMIKVRDHMRDHVRHEGGKGKVIELVEYLLGSPLVSATSVQKSLDVTPTTANRVIKQLEDLGYLTKLSGERYRRRYICEQIASIIE